MTSPGVPAAASGSYPLRPGNVLRPLIDGEPAFDRICECVDAARHSVWVTVAYIDRDVRMPGRRGTFFDVLDGAAARGVDVRVLFWREPRLREVEPGARHFPGTPHELRWLGQRRARILARWDRLPEAYCQHQKSWIVDAGRAGEVAFVGGINLDRPSVAPPGHAPRASAQFHDLYVELRGPAATDVHHNFVQRWNEASERGAPGGEWPDARAGGDLPFPGALSSEAGDAAAQVTRTVMPGRYRDDTPAPGAPRFPIAEGERSVLEQYLAAIGSAQRTVYMENQAIASPAVVEALEASVQRGVEVVFVVPGNAHPAFARARRNPRAAFFFERLGKLGQHENFTLVAIAACRGEGRYEEVYVHAKIALVDDAWATIGSANVAERSFRRDTELNVSFWHPPTVRSLRQSLLLEHLGRDVSGWDDRAALALLRETALRNRERRLCWEPLEGLAYALEPREYGS